MIRLATKNDIPKLISLAQQTINSTCAKDYSTKQTKAWASRLNRPNRFEIAIEKQHFVVALINNEIVGFGSIKNGNYLDFLYVSTNHLRKGIAQDLYTNLLLKSRDLGQKTIKSDVSLTAAPFFIKQGFVILKKQENQIGDEILLNYKMELNLEL